MNLFSEVLTDLLGSYKASFYITYFIFVMFGIIVSLRVAALKRDPNSKATPIKFSLKFLVRDNLVRVLGSIALVFVSIRFGTDLFDVVPEYYTAVLMGFSFDFILLKIEKWQDLAREKLK